MKRIKILIMDVDGTLTDGKINMSNEGEIFKSFSVKDGSAIKVLLKEMEVVPVFLTGRKSNIVNNRAKELCVTEVYQGVQDKLKVLQILADKYDISYDEIAVIGDDINDLPLFRNCTSTACPSDASEVIKNESRIVLNNRGGEGAVQEFIYYLYSEFIEMGYIDGLQS